MLLYLIRHGEPDYENDCLTEKGIKQAKLVAKRLKESRIDRVYSSELGRATETAKYTCELIGKKAEILPWAHEIGAKTLFPDGSEKSVALVPNVYLRSPEYIDLSFDRAFECGGFNDNSLKEQYEKMIAGALGFLEEQGFKEEDGIFKIIKPNTEKIAIFCHGNMIRSLIAHLLHIPIHIAWAGLGYSFTGVTVINFNNSERGNCAPRVLTYADISHLPVAEGGRVYNENRNLII